MSRVDRSRPRLVVLAAVLVAVIAAVHLQQYIDFISEVPTIGVLFLLNAAGGGGLAVALISAEGQLRLLAALGAILLAGGSLIAIAVALSGSLFGYSEATVRVPILIAIIAELAAIPALVTLVIREVRADLVDTTSPVPASASSGR